MIARPAEAFYIALQTFIIDKGLMPSSFFGKYFGDNVCTPVMSCAMQKQNLEAFFKHGRYQNSPIKKWEGCLLGCILLAFWKKKSCLWKKWLTSLSSG